MTEDDKVMKTTRVVPCDEKEMEEEDEDLQRIGWNWTTDPDGKLFYFNKETGEKSWTTPLRVEVATEEPTTEEIPTRRTKLVGKQPPPKHYLKTLVAEVEDEEGDEDGDVTKTITLQEVYQNIEEWIPAMKAELESQYSKESLIPRDLKDVKTLQKTSNKKIKLIPAKLVATKKKKARQAKKNKARIVACGNKDLDEEGGTKDTYAGGADATAVRSAIRTAALGDWTIRTKDVSTAFLNAPYEVEGEEMFLIPPKVYVKAGLVKETEVWQVNRAIYGLKKAPLLGPKKETES